MTTTPHLDPELKKAFLYSCGEYAFDFEKACDFLAQALADQRKELVGQILNKSTDCKDTHDWKFELLEELEKTL